MSLVTISFHFLMTVMFHDVHEKVNRLFQVGKLDFFDHWEVLFADDTLIAGKRARELNIILHAIEE